MFIRGRKLNKSFVFIKQSCFKVQKDTTHILINRILNKRELKQIAINLSSDDDFKDFIKIYKKYVLMAKLLKNIQKQRKTKEKKQVVALKVSKSNTQELTFNDIIPEDILN